ncbi:MAG: sulfatase-like hydrolase/transferase [Verrucomicrobiales bacterium]
MAAALKKAGYATACVGKWHLGHLPQYLPTSHGFDSYFGIPYSNDMDRVGKGNGRQLLMEPKNEYWNVPLLRGEEVIERPPQQADLTRRYTEEAIKFIDANKEKPFFLYLAHSMPHVPLFASDKFRGTSTRGLYGDVIEEIDWSAGQITGALRERGLDKNTLFVFTSDNGPWLIFNQHGGTAGLLREGKGCTFEGGMREPTIFWWPGKVAPGIQHGMGSTLDLFPTAMALAGAEMPGDREYDGYDLSGALLGGEESPRDRMFYYWGTELYAARLGDWKAHFTTYVEYVGQKHQKHETPLLYNVAEDPGERFDRAKDHPDVIAKIAAAAEAHKATVKPVENQLERR